MYFSRIFLLRFPSFYNVGTLCNCHTFFITPPQGAALPVENIVHYNGRDEMVEAINNEEVSTGCPKKSVLKHIG